MKKKIYPHQISLQGKTTNGLVQITIEREKDYSDKLHVDWWILKVKWKKYLKISLVRGGVNMIYFKSVPQYGDLEIEKVLFLFDNIPMIFICRDDKKRYFLCQCVDVIDKFSWMITPVQKRLLISMMKDEISVLSAFKDSGYDIILADEVKNEIGYRKIPFKNISLDELPDPDEKLENPDLREYIEQLQKEEIIYKADKIAL